MSKTSARRKRQQQRIEAEKSSGRTFLVVIAALVTVLGVAVAVGLSGRDPSASTGAKNERRIGAASALDLVSDVKTVALGRVPLNKTVIPTWKLTNKGEGTIALGEPHAEVVEGCCPGPLQLGTKSLGAGESTDLTFPLQMHPGMDGLHEFSIHVPVESDGEKDLLTLTTTGDFRN